MKEVLSILILCISILSFAQIQTPFTEKKDFNIEDGPNSVSEMTELNCNCKDVLYQ